jgi:hypothetical protein
VRFLKEDPSHCGIIADKPVPDCIKEVPPEGWSEIPHCSYRDEKVVQALKEFYTVYISMKKREYSLTHIIYYT